MPCLGSSLPVVGNAHHHNKRRHTLSSSQQKLRCAAPCPHSVPSLLHFLVSFNHSCPCDGIFSFAPQFHWCSQLIHCWRACQCNAFLDHPSHLSIVIDHHPIHHHYLSMPSTLDHPDKREPTPPTPAQHPPQSHRNSIVLPSISESIPEFGSPHHNTQTTAPDPATASQSAPSTGQGQIVFTRKLWHRSMPNEPIDVLVSRHPDKLITDVPNQSDASASHRATSSISRPLRSPHSPSTDSRTPLTPEESPPYRSTRKRRASTLEADERALESAEPSPSHARANSGDSAVQVCICQPDPKIPRPRNGESSQ